MKTTDKNFLYRLSTIRQLAFSLLEQELKNAEIKDIPASYGDILHTVNRLGCGYVSDIVNSTYRDKSTVSTIINNLCKKGYVEKISDREDGRRVKVKLTDKAVKYTEKAPDISAVLRNELFKGMSEEEKKILFMLIDKIENNLKI